MSAETYQPDYGQTFNVDRANLLIGRGQWRVYDWTLTRVEVVPVVLGEPYWPHAASIPRWYAAKLWRLQSVTTTGDSTKGGQ